MFVNLYVQEPDFGEHNFADFLDQIERVEATYIRKHIESSYSDEHDPIEPYFFAMMRLTLTSGTAAAYIRTHPDLPITERDCRLSKLFQFLYVPLEIHFGLPESPEWETRVSLEELLDSLPDHHISRLQEFDWWSFYEDTRSHDLDTVISRLRERLPSFSDDNTPVGEKAIRDDGIGRASRRESVGALSAGGDQRQAVESAQMPLAQEPQGPRESRKAKKPVRRSAQSLAPLAGMGKPDKRNLDILCTDGKLKRAVTLDVARRFGGVSRRAIDEAAHKGLIKTEGRRQQRRVLVESLVKYFPSEK